LLTVIAGPARGKIFTFEEPDCFLFGRAADARVSLPDDPFVSRHHFLLEVAPPHCKVTDLDSKNGLFVNNVRYGGRKPAAAGVAQAPNGTKDTLLRDGDEIIVGDTRMKIAVELDGHHVEAKAQPVAPVRHAIGAGSRALRDQVLAFAGTELGLPGAPEILGYHIEKELGRGGMGVVYQATQVSTGRRVAIKTMLPSVAANEQSVRTFQREVEISRQLKHPNVVEVLDHGRVGGTFFFVLEFVDGMDLSKYLSLQRGPLNLGEAAPLMLGILTGLAHAHRAELAVPVLPGGNRTFIGMVHRDLKPQNILLTKSAAGWIPKVADFGLAKSFESAGLTDMTDPGQLCGTPVYWPREQITHYKYLAPPTDVFSIAAVFYEMLTGGYMREGFPEMLAQCAKRGQHPGIADYMRVIVSNPIVGLRTRNPRIPAAVADVIDRATHEAEVPADEQKMRATLANLRYPDAGVFLRELAESLNKIGISV
jgi:serine/threonine protein kinase